MVFSKTLLLKESYLQQKIKIIDKLSLSRWYSTHCKAKIASCFQRKNLNVDVKSHDVDQDLKSTVLKRPESIAYKLFLRLGHACEAGSQPSFILWETKGSLYGESSI
nr:protein E18A [Elephantid betaherpesvirus 1]